MAVGFRGAGAWTTAIVADFNPGLTFSPGTPEVTDLMLIIASWKDFAITAQITDIPGWTEITEFADGAVATGNGTGSMKVAAWWKEHDGDESDPTVDFSTTVGLLASCTVLAFTKGGSETWDTPTFVTAAMTTWTTTPQTTNASSTITVPSGGAVVGLAGIRDDSATFTRPTTGISDSGGLITWNGNYAEAPATHASTTTGNDMSADAGYRLVTTGAAGVTLRQTCDALSAAETGALLWVVLGATAAAAERVPKYQPMPQLLAQ